MKNKEDTIFRIFLKSFMLSIAGVYLISLGKILGLLYQCQQLLPSSILRLYDPVTENNLFIVGCSFALTGMIGVLITAFSDMTFDLIKGLKK